MAAVVADGGRDAFYSIPLPAASVPAREQAVAYREPMRSMTLPVRPGSSDAATADRSLVERPGRAHVRLEHARGGQSLDCAQHAQQL